MTEYRVDELARHAGTSVRNIRVYQDRGLVDPPRREGRIAYYSDRHLERLRLVGRLLDRGYTFATIAELLDAWSDGGGLGRVLGFAEAIGGPWPAEEPGHVTVDELRERLGCDDVAAFVTGALEVGVLDRDGSGFRVRSPHLLDAATDLLTAGIPLSAVHDLTAELQEHLDRVAELVLRTVSENLPSMVEAAQRRCGTPGREGPPAGTICGRTDATAGVQAAAAQVAEVIQQLRPHATRAVKAMFALSMRERAEQVVKELSDDDQLTG